MRRAFGLLLLILIATSGMGAWWLIRAIPPARPCTSRDLLIDERLFPSGATSSLLWPHPEGGAGRTIYFPGGLANHRVVAYRLIPFAVWEFRRAKEYKFGVGFYDGPWERPEALEYRSPIADQYYLACGQRADHGFRCKLVARYDEYLVLFDAHMFPTGLTYRELERILRAIDERMAGCLGIPFPGSEDKPGE